MIVDFNNQSAFVLSGKNLGAHATIYFGSGEACKTQLEAIEAAEFLKAYFEAKAKGHHISLAIDDVPKSAEFAQDMMKDGYRQAMNDMRTVAQCEPTQIARQIRMERYAADFFCHYAGRDPDPKWCVSMAAELMDLVAERMEKENKEKYGI